MDKNTPTQDFLVWAFIGLCLILFSLLLMGCGAKKQTIDSSSESQSKTEITRLSSERSGLSIFTRNDISKVVRRYFYSVPDSLGNQHLTAIEEERTQDDSSTHSQSHLVSEDSIHVDKSDGLKTTQKVTTKTALPWYTRWGIQIAIFIIGAAFFSVCYFYFKK